MIEQLTELLKQAMIENPKNNMSDALLYEFSTGEKIYLNKTKLSRDQINLLNIFLTPITNKNQSEKADQLFWKAIVNGNKQVFNKAPITAPYYQFIHFSITGELQSISEFEEAIQNQFTQEITLVWNSNDNGFIVVYITDEGIEETEDINIGAMIDTIISDFYVQMTIFKGSLFSNYSEAYSLYTWEKSAFALAKRVLPNETSFNKENLIPYVVVNEVSPRTSKIVLQTINALHEDKELLKTIKVFFECNLNTTLAAKKLFMHRNSLQYRIDKFIEKTGIDIKQFQQAAAIYLLIALDETKKDVEKN